MKAGSPVIFSSCTAVLFITSCWCFMLVVYQHIAIKYNKEKPGYPCQCSDWTVGLMTAVHFPAGAMMGFFLFTTTSKPALGSTQPPIQSVPWALTPEVKWQGHEANCSPPSSAEVRNVWSYTSTPQYIFMAWCLIKQEICLHCVVLS
jgi:hypothetical protein